MLTGCTSAAQTRQNEAQNIKLSAPASEPVVGEHPTLTTKKPKKPVKISIIAIENNPFFAQVKTGYAAIKPKIEALGGKVVWINAGTEVNVDNVGKAINAASVDNSDAIAALMPGDGICSYVRSATADGILVAAYNGNATCSEKAGAVFFHGQDLYAAGGQAGQLMCKATADLASAAKPGKVGIETESFTFQALEDRRHGFLDALKKNCPWVTPVGDGIEYQGSTDRIASATRDFMTSTPNLVGVYVTGGNPNIAAETVGQQGKAAQVKVIAFDFTAQNVAQIKAGNLYAAIDQDPYGQSYDTIAWLYNAVVTHVKPSSKYFIPTKVIVGTKENIDQVTQG
jgi:ABC-type sugar transport system substrate-binding protein